MTRTFKAILVPPLAVYHHGYAGNTAGPIAVFWVTALAAIAFAAGGGTLAGIAVTRWVILAIGVALWAIAAAWAELVVKAVEDDLRHRHTSPLDHRVVPHDDDPDPLRQLTRAKLIRGQFPVRRKR